VPFEALIDADMVAYSIRVPAPDVVFVKGLLEASEGLAAVFAVKGGDLVLAAPRSQDAELRQFIAELRIELNLEVEPNVE